LFSCRAEPASTWPPATENQARCVHSGPSGERSRACLLRSPSEIDCEASAIVFFLGLLFGFQRPSCFPTNLRGAHLLFHASAAVNSRPLPASSSGKNPPSGFVLPFLRRGAASTSSPHWVSTDFVDPSFRSAHSPLHRCAEDVSRRGRISTASSLSRQIFLDRAGRSRPAG
jgi:hypothetical protein